MKLLAFCGKARSGKDSSANYVVGNVMVASEIVDEFYITENGELLVPAMVGEEIKLAGLNLSSKDEGFIQFASRKLWPHVKTYAFADPLKEFCINVLGLTYEQCYGTTEDKNSLTNLKWENMPGVITQGVLENHNIKNGPLLDWVRVHERGLMTAREVLQYFGTDIVRKMYHNAWADACIRQIQAEESNFAIITDCRFVNEVEAVKKAGGRVIRLLRKISDDDHKSETELDSYTEYDYVIDNNNITLKEKDIELHKVLCDWGWLT